MPLVQQNHSLAIERIGNKCSMRTFLPLLLLCCALGADSFNSESSAHVPRIVKSTYFY